MKHSIVVPHLGATGGDMKIVAWLVEEGQRVKAGDILFEVETDKSTSEVEAFRDGFVRQILLDAGSQCAPGDVVALLTDDVGEAADQLNLGVPAQPRSARIAIGKVRPKPVPGPASVRPDAVLRADAAPAAVVGPEQLIGAFRMMVLIRRYEEHLYALFLQGLVPGTLHQCQGQEAVAVGACAALRRDDVVYSTHRPVGHLIAKGASVDAITAEIWGKATGCVGGKGGQMHLADFSVGAMVSNAIVGANIPIAVGSAMGFRLMGLDRVAVSFFGDGAANSGAFHEGLNLAAVQRAPVVFVCENNLYAASTHISLTMLINDIADRAAAYGMPGVCIDGMDVEAVYRAAAAAVDRARRGHGPTLIECKTYRYRGHSRGDPGGYRDQEEHRRWLERDPIKRLRERLTGDFGVPDERLDAIEREQQQRVEAAVAFALASPDPPPLSAVDHVFAP
jgi:TPP-dependent pyruvate/acetoin dehydrogenase alpha subunit